ncbi:hypothetical protein AAFF_G00124900 [Aldrovandia affinis]|uniref:Uncharacterized protein n=1 Tax=Aldrovandia affinis TaxID=143900 RepID=A0AAD7RRA0_9TELE|nr:hypothetical protein AAFF_G00124900 [Aldrovandia affinis]
MNKLKLRRLRLAPTAEGWDGAVHTASGARTGMNAPCDQTLVPFIPSSPPQLQHDPLCDAMTLEQMLTLIVWNARFEHNCCGLKREPYDETKNCVLNIF